jgi:cytosine/adenosine deaminase-related metal-dependent hydrolase
MIHTIHRAKYVLPEPDLLLQNGAVYVSGAGRILRVEHWNGPPANMRHRLKDWGSAVLMPGFVNCHAHIELTHLHNRIVRFSSFTNWISQLMAHRSEWSERDLLESALAGSALSVASGTVLLGDISSAGASWQALKSAGMRKVVFEEIVGLSPDKVHETADSLSHRLGTVAGDDMLISGISPHAPYSVSADLYRTTAKMAADRGLLMATHVAETEAEIKFLHYGTGEFRDFLSGLGALPAGWSPPRLAPVQYLHSLGVLGRTCLLIHCNYLDSDSMALIVSNNSSVVYCPRSHTFFGHKEHPVRQLLDMGVNVALGTDSLASNSTLSMLDEMRFLFRKRKDLRCEEIFRMATLNGASALNFGNTVGRLRRGYRADMTVLRVPEELPGRNVTAQILEGAGECVATIMGGEMVWERPRQ